MGRRFLASLLLVFVVCLTAFPRAQQAAAVIGTHDVLTISVFGEPTLSGKFTVDQDGAFEYPLLGRVIAGGRTPRDLEIDLMKRLGDGFLKSPQATVELEQAARQRVFIMGEVRTPGTYQLTSDVTLIEALARAGSTNPGAAQEILILRPRAAKGDGPILPGKNVGAGLQVGPEQDAEVIRVDLRELQTAGLLRNNITLRDGDTIFVPKAQLVYITGQVRSPGAYAIEPGTTVLQALSLAGGVAERGASGRIKIVRLVSNKSKEMSVKLTDLVEPGDTIVVPERFF